MLSDYPERKTIRSYGVLNEKSMSAMRSFFLVDPEGTVRGIWRVESGATTVVYSDTLLRDIAQIMKQK